MLAGLPGLFQVVTLDDDLLFAGGIFHPGEQLRQLFPAAEQAQMVCDCMTAGGVLAIWNFAPVKLAVPENVIVHNENLTASLSALSSMLRQRKSHNK